jgi:hypothetical protein
MMDIVGGSSYTPHSVNQLYSCLKEVPVIMVIKFHPYVTSSDSSQYLDCDFSGMTLEHCDKHLTVAEAHILTRVVKTSHKLLGIISATSGIPADREFF